MAKKIVDKAVISVEEKDNLESTWYRYNALLDLIKSGLNDDFTMARYEKSYMDFNKAWAGIIKTNFKQNYTDTKIYDWECDFETRVVEIIKK